MTDFFLGYGFFVLVVCHLHSYIVLVVASFHNMRRLLFVSAKPNQLLRELLKGQKNSSWCVNLDCVSIYQNHDFLKDCLLDTCPTSSHDESSSTESCLVCRQSLSFEDFVGRTTSNLCSTVQRR